MGDTGPCGPCSEIHVDLRDDRERAKIPGHTLVNKGNPLVIEIWNLVFIQYNRLANGRLEELPAKHVDTGLGFERLCMILQGKRSNYDTDVFLPIIHALADQAEIDYGSGEKTDIAMRVVADHLRAISFAIADGQLPSNVKAGYVIRRILRRAVRYGFAFLNFKEPFLFNLVPVLVHQMEQVFPELYAQQVLITNVIREEESSFLRTLATGIQRFNGYITPPQATLPQRGKGPEGRVIDGSFAFELFDTYGFPIDLTQLMSREMGWSVDMEGFRKGLEEQKARSRKAATTEASDWIILAEEQTKTEFVGYDILKTETEIVKYRKVLSKGEQYYQIVLEQTPFYAESGGQAGDRGWLISKEEKIEVEDTIQEHDQIIHITRKLMIHPDLPVTAEVDGVKRRMTANNHTATHLMHAALRSILGSHVEQKGSLVDESHLRFDFTHFTRMTREEIASVERIVNAKIRANIPILEDRSMAMEKAKEMGAMALFGEKYGDRVRVIMFDPSFSVELCGGTHVPATGQIGLFKIVSESAIAAGIRRIEAITAEQAEAWWTEKEHLLASISDLLKAPKDLLKGIQNLVEETQTLRKVAEEFRKTKESSVKESLKSQMIQTGSITFLAARVDLDPESMKNLGFQLRSEIQNLFLVLASESTGKANLMVTLSDILVKEHGMNAGTIIRELSMEIGGGGGGQPHIATAGGKNPAGIPAALEKAKSFIP
jgi:alanyl-tRNA synthetase